MKKFILWTLLLVVLGGGGWLGWKWYTASQSTLAAMTLVPSDAIYIIETDEPIENWDRISSSPMWKHLQKNDYFAEITAGAHSLDSLIKENKSVFDILGYRSVLISAHNYTAKDYDFLFVVDVTEAAGITALQQYMSGLASGDLIIRKKKYKDYDIFEMYDKSDKSTLYFSFIEKYFIASYRNTILYSSIDTKEKSHLADDERFKKVAQEVAGKDLFRVYMNYSMLDEYMKCYSDESNEYVKSISKSLLYSGLSFDYTSTNRLLIKGTTLVNDTARTYVRAMLKSGTGGIDIPNVTPDRTSFYMGLGFENFSLFMKNFEELLKEDVASWNEYKENISKVEKYLNISLEKNFMSWIGSEVAFVQLPSAGLGKENEFAVVLKASDIGKAKKEIDYVNKQIRKKTPVKFKSIEHKGYTVNYMAVKGLFKALLGKFFAKLEKPYYTIIDDYVIYSNHPETIKGFIDDYVAGKTLQKNETYLSFRNEFKDKNNLFMYANTAALYPQMLGFADDETRYGMTKNEKFITCFTQFGFQLSGDGDQFKTIMASQFVEPVEPVSAETPAGAEDENTEEEQGGEAPEKDPFELPRIYVKDPDAKEYKEYYEDSTIHYTVQLKYGFKEGEFIEYYPNGRVKLKGKFKKDERDGTWKAYDEEGELVKKAEYSSGVLVE